MGDLTISKVIECRTDFDEGAPFVREDGFDNVIFSCHITRSHFSELYLALETGEFILSGVYFENEDLTAFRREGTCI